MIVHGLGFRLTKMGLFLLGVLFHQSESLYVSDPVYCMDYHACTYAHAPVRDIYMYFNLNDDARGFHLMGANAMAAPSPLAEPVTSASLPPNKSDHKFPWSFIIPLG